MVNDVVIVAAARTPITKALRGTFANVRAEDLAIAAIAGALDKVPTVDRASIDEFITGSWMHTGSQSGNIARRIAVMMGYDAVPGVTVNRACASSLQAIRMAHHAIALGEADVVVASGVESISGYTEPTGAGSTPDHDRHPFFNQAAQRTRLAVGDNATWADPREAGESPDIYLAMGHTAENVASLRGITREEQDAFALRSQRLARQASDEGFFAREIVPVTVGDDIVLSDESVRSETTAEGLASLKPVFRPQGTITAGNCCPLSDGAAAVVVMSADKARALQLSPLARIRSYGVSALSPEIMGLGPVESTRKALLKANMSIDDIDLVEMNEAFAAQVLPSCHDLGLDLDRVNVHGGAIALGHPFGMGGARLTTTLLNGLIARDVNVGLVTMCAAGGQGMSMIVERI